MLVELDNPVEKSEDVLVCLNAKLVTTQLMKICKEGGQKSVFKLKKLIQLSEEIQDGLDEDGCSSLILAVKNGHRDIISMLLDYDGLKNRYSIDWRDKSNMTAFMHAKQQGFVDVMEGLMMKGATDLPLPKDTNSVLIEHVFLTKPLGFKVNKGKSGVVISSFNRDDVSKELEVGWKLVKITIRLWTSQKWMLL
eukprot:TRINITY_DN2379_c0_g1_i1.p1 TRINITY_DN2379_c0_g1~~TRINITY_DN2379_c0_g1_i1.p1  ORF type:complete len:194 (-),score=29.89 TRINITY_DN2379_c0_g1_i1:127-708(-)